VAAGAQFEGNLPGLAGTDESQLAGLGRLDTDENWVLAKWGVGAAFFLEPFFSENPTQLVHEISFSSRGQYTFGNQRLVPQQEEIIGGFYSVRGYPEALDAGDTVFVGTGEYRFYLARALRIVPQGNISVGSKTSWREQFANPFRFRAKDVYGRSNWDLILRTFIEGGQTYNNRRRPTETDRSLLSTGVGVELQVRRNLDLRLDYGIALKSETENLANPVSYGSSRVHFSATVAW
jgi:hemolysin activation/secretion protein